MQYMRQSNTFPFEEDFFSKGAQGITFIYHEVLLLMKFLQANPQLESLKMSFYDL